MERTKERTRACVCVRACALASAREVEGREEAIDRAEVNHPGARGNCRVRVKATRE